jgi:hypothetical protein
LGRKLVLQASALDLDLGLLGVERRLGLALLRFGGLRVRFGLGVDLRLLQATFPSQIVVSGQRASGFLGLSGELADQAARSLLRVLVISQIVISFVVDLGTTSRA